MKNYKKILAIFLCILCLFSTVSVIASAKSYTSNPVKICRSSSGYSNINKTTMYGQNSSEKYVVLGKGDTLKVKTWTSVNAHKGVKDYVRFTVWVYDINTGKRVDNEICYNNDTATYKNNTGKNLHLSVQVRPYIALSAWNKYDVSLINAYIRNSSFKFECTGIK